MEILRRRKIERFVHFTRLENLEGILRSGLIPAATLQNLVLSTPFLRNDRSRWDGLPEASCLSVTYPNHLMFQSMRADGNNWAVLGFSAAKVLRLPSIFITTNAAKGARKCHLSSLKHQATPLAFECMFPDEPWLSRLNIAGNEPCDVQAEVMVLDTIPPEMLTFVAPYRTALAELEPLFPICPPHVDWLLEPSELWTRLVTGRVHEPFSI